MTDEKRAELNKNEMLLTLCAFPIYHSTTLPTVIYNAFREGWSDIVFILVSVFFSPVIPISYQNIFYLLVYILFSAPTLSELKLIIFRFFLFSWTISVLMAMASSS